MRLRCEREPFLFLSPKIQTRMEVRTLSSVSLRPNESQEQLFRRFKKKVAKSGNLSVVQSKRWFISKSELRRIEKKQAARRSRRRKAEEE